MNCRRKTLVERTSSTRQDDHVGVDVDGRSGEPIKKELLIHDVFAVLDQQGFYSSTECFNGLIAGRKCDSMF